MSAVYRGGGVEVVRLLVRLGASISCADPELGNTALHWAVAGGSAGSLASLVTAVTSLKYSGTTAYTHLPWEARNNQEHWEKAELDPFPFPFKHFVKTLSCQYSFPFSR